MRKVTTTEMQFQGGELFLYPCAKSINHRQLSAGICSQVDAVLDQPREQMLTDLVVDLTAVTSISSAGLNELIRLKALTRASGINLRFRCVNDAVRDVFRITRLERSFHFEGNGGEEPIGSESDAVAATTV